MTALIERLEAAAEGSRELDVAIFDKVEWLQRPEDEPPNYTTSLDSAVMLVPKNWEWKLSTFANLIRASVYKPPIEQHDGAMKQEGFNNGGATPALALCVAALKARAAK